MQQITPARFAPDFVTTMRWALDVASDRVPVMSRTPATKAKMAQRIVRSAHEGIRDAHQLVAVAEGMVPAL
jgi:hypothetical protein